MKPCIAPQSSEHCPLKFPLMSKFKRVVTTRPGIASILTANVGIAIAWITSTAESTNVEIPTPKSTLLPTAKPSKFPNSRNGKSEISFAFSVQYHWIPAISEIKLCESEIETGSTNWFKLMTLIVGISNEINSSFREDENIEMRDGIWLTFLLLSRVEAINATTATNTPPNTPHKIDEVANINLLIWCYSDRQEGVNTQI